MSTEVPTMNHNDFDLPDVPLGPEFDGIDRVLRVGGVNRDAVIAHFGEFNAVHDDIDLMVVGVGPEEMLDRGFSLIDAESTQSVFHDSRGREVALPRAEQSTGAGYHDFDMKVLPPEVPAEEAIRRDLERRDLTINAIATDVRTGEVFDPFNGVQDARDGVIRHVSEAFRDDPLRVVRAARYTARFDFEIHPDTEALMRETAPKMDALPGDRFGTELVKALKQAREPRRFFDVLDRVDALDVAFPELAALKGVPAGPDHAHREGDSLEHTLRVLTELHDRRGNDVPALLAAVVHDVGKAKTPDSTLPSHPRHHTLGKPIAVEMRKRLGLSRDLRGVGTFATREHMKLHDIEELRATTLLDAAKAVSESPLSPEQAADLQAADALGREPAGGVKAGQVVERIQAAQAVIEEIDGAAVMDSRGWEPADIGTEISGENFGNVVRQDRAEALRACL